MSTHGLLLQSAVTLRSKGNGWLAVNQDNVYPRTVVSMSCHYKTPAVLFWLDVNQNVTCPRHIAKKLHPSPKPKITIMLHVIPDIVESGVKHQ